MDPDRRSEIRQSRRERRARGSSNGPAAAARRPSPSSGPAADGDGITLQQRQQQQQPRRRRATDGGGGGGSGVGGMMGGAARLTDKLQRRREAESRRQAALTSREQDIQNRYAPYVMELFQVQQEQQRGGGGVHASNAAASDDIWANAARLQALTDFDKDDLLAELISDNKANFLRLDRELSNDHALATQRLHSSVFTHANDFLLLFRDVDKAGVLVEALKANVQGTKAAISAISKFSYANRDGTGLGSTTTTTTGGGGGRSATAATAAAGTGVFGGAGGSVASRIRPSLVSRRPRPSGGGGTEIGEDITAAADAAGGSSGQLDRFTYGSDHRHTTTAVNISTNTSNCGAPTVTATGTGGGTTATATTRATTHSLNVPSVLKWRYTVGRDSLAVDSHEVEGASSANSNTTSGGAMKGRTASGTSGVTPRQAAATRAKESNEIQMLADIVTEETSQLLAERRPLEAAQLLGGVAAEAIRLGCLPLLLDLEAAAVQAVLRSLSLVPVVPMYIETVHVPLVQLLMRLGRVRSGSSAYLNLQTVWLQGELRKLQSRVNPSHASLVTVDFLAGAMCDVLQRQHTLGLPLVDARRVIAAEKKGGAAAGAAVVAEIIARGGRPDTSGTTAAAAAAAAAAESEDGAKGKARRLTRTRDGATMASSSSSPPPPSSSSAAAAAAAAPVAADKSALLVPPNSAALLWVRRNVESYAREILSTHMLSYGTGIDGGDPSRVRRAMAMLAESIHVLSVMTAEGFAGCDTLILAQLTPSLVVLQSEFTRLTEARVDSAGRTMVEQLLSNAMWSYDTLLQSSSPSGKLVYVPSANADVARRSNARSQDLLRALKAAALPCCSHSWLVQLLLCPAASTMFDRGSAGLLSTGGGGPLLLSASSSPAPSATRRGRPGAAAAAILAPTTTAPATTSTSSDASLLPLEDYRFLRYSSGCTAVHDVLIQSLVSFTCAMVGRDWKHGASPPAPAAAARSGGGGGVAVSASAPSSASNRFGQSATTHPGTDNTTTATAPEAAAAAKEREESSRFLLSNALLTESFDVTMTRLMHSFLTASLRARTALLSHLASAAFTRRHRRLFPAGYYTQRKRAKGRGGPSSSSSSSAPPMPFFCDATLSPAWVMDSMSALLCDVVSVGVWASYLGTGSAVSHIVHVPSLAYRPRHLERLRVAMPRVAQGWLAATLALGHDVGVAATLAPAPKTAATGTTAAARGKAAGQQPAKTKSPAAAVLSVPSSALSGFSPPRSRKDGQRGGTTTTTTSTQNTMGEHESSSYDAALVREQSVYLGSMGAADDNGNHGNNSGSSGMSGGGDAGILMAATGLVTIRVRSMGGGGASSPNGDDDDDLANNASMIVTTTTGNSSVVAYEDAGLGDKNHHHHNNSGIKRRLVLSDATLNEDRLLSLLMALLDRKFATPAGYTAHRALAAANCVDGGGGGGHDQNSNDGGGGPPSAIWSVRRALKSYPEFPIGGSFNRGDELFLFHWLAQITLQLLAIFQERLLTPSYVLNGKAADIHSNSNNGKQQQRRQQSSVFDGSVSPAEDSVLSSLCAGGGNYVAAVCLLQFLVVRLLRDGLCRAATWSAVYGTATAQEWRRDERCLRQQLFFFAAFVRVWSPLFCGGENSLANGGGGGGGVGGSSATRRASPTTAAAAGSAVSATNVDGIPSLAVLEWLTCGGVLRLRVTAATTASTTATTATAGDRVTAIDVLFGGSGGGEGEDGGDTPAAAAADSAAEKAWKASDTASNNNAGGGVFAATGDARSAALKAVAATTGGGPARMPDTLLRVIRRFFEEDLGEPRAIPGLTSDLMRKKVDKALGAINLSEFVGTSLGEDDDDDDEDDEEDEEEKKDGQRPAQHVTMENVRDLLARYLRPFQ